jgi:hypothetical protein
MVPAHPAAPLPEAVAAPLALAEAGVPLAASVPAVTVHDGWAS